MKQPGDTLRALAARVCSASTMEHMIDPAIADLQCEHADAIRRGARWQGFWIRLGGSWAFCRLIAAVAASRSVTAPREWAAADGWAVGRVLGFATVIAVVGTVLLALVPLLQPGSPFRSERPLGPLPFLYLVPSTLPLTIPIGLLFGILYAMRGRAVAKRVRSATAMIGLACAVGSFSMLGWIIPASNQAFRETVSGLPAQQLFKGPNELALGELRQEMRDLNGGAMRGSVQERSVTFTYYQRFALSVVPMVFGLFALGVLNVGRLRRSRVALGAVAVTACVGYYVLLSISRVAVVGGWNAAWVWLPNFCSVAGIMLLQGARRARRTQ